VCAVWSMVKTYSFALLILKKVLIAWLGKNDRNSREILKNIGVDWKDRRLIMNLYMNQKVVIKVNQECSEECDMGRGVRQGCRLSPLLFTINADAMMTEAMEAT